MDIKESYNDKNTSDFTIASKSDKIYCHKSIVSKNLYIYTYLQNENKLNVDPTQLSIDDDDFDCFKIIIEGLYHSLDLTELSIDDITGLYHVADKYMDQNMKDIIFSHMIESNNSLFNFYKLSRHYFDQYIIDKINKYIINKQDSVLIVEYYKLLNEYDDNPEKGNPSDKVTQKLLIDCIKNVIELTSQNKIIISQSGIDELIDALKYAIDVREPIEINGVRYKKFNFDNITKHPKVGIIGRRCSGKTWLAKDILRNLNIPTGIVISLTKDMSNEYHEIIYPEYIHSNYNKELIENLLHRQELIIEKKLSDVNAYLVMDNCLSSKFKFDDTIRDIFLTDRNYCLSFIITMEFPLKIPPDLRQKFDYIFITAEYFINNKQKLYNAYGGMFPTFDAFQTVFDDIIYRNNYNFMVIDCNPKSNDIHDHIFWYKAEKIPTGFKLSNNQIDEFHKKYFNIS